MIPNRYTYREDRFEGSRIAWFVTHPKGEEELCLDDSSIGYCGVLGNNYDAGSDVVPFWWSLCFLHILQKIRGGMNSLELQAKGCFKNLFYATFSRISENNKWYSRCLHPQFHHIWLWLNLNLEVSGGNSAAQSTNMKGVLFQPKGKEDHIRRRPLGCPFKKDHAKILTSDRNNVNAWSGWGRTLTSVLVMMTSQPILAFLSMMAFLYNKSALLWESGWTNKRRQHCSKLAVIKYHRGHVAREQWNVQSIYFWLKDNSLVYNVWENCSPLSLEIARQGL